MKLYFDTRLGYLVTSPGQESALTGFSLKVGDTSTIDIEFGKSADPSGTPSFISGSTWTKEQLTGGSNITIGFKEDGDYADGTLLAGSSSFSYSDYVYTFSVSLNTTALNTAFARDDADDTNDIATLATSFEVTYQPGGSGGWLSSILPVTATIYNDVLLGDESSPATATDPDEYLLKQDGIRWLSTVTSKIGGTAADLDSIATVSLDVGTRVQFSDEDGASPILVDYKLEAGTDAESSPDVIRPDDYDGSTNAKVWKLKQAAATSGINNVVEDVTPQLGGVLDTNSNQVRWSKGADVASASALTLGDDGNYFDITGTTSITSIGTKGVGTRVLLQFDGILTLTHSASDLVLISGANITTAAGDHAEFLEYASGDWRMVSYSRADGTALVASSGGALLADGTVDGTARQTLKLLNVSKQSATINSGQIAVNSSLVELTSQTGTTDTLLGMTGGSEGDIVYLSAVATHTITVGSASVSDGIRNGTPVDITSLDVYGVIKKGNNWFPIMP